VTPRRAHRRRALGALAVSGADRETFLQGQLTQDVRGLRDGAARRMAGLTARGKLLYFGWLVGEPDRALLLVPAPARETARAHLARFAVLQKVTVEDATDGYVAWSLYGPAASILTLPGNAVLLPAEGEISGSVLAPASDEGRVMGALREAGSQELSETEAEVLRIEAGRPRFGVDADASNLPDEVGLQDAISTTKGCYVGQEVVARLRTYGKVSRRLVGFRFAGGALPAGTEFPDPEKADHLLGRVTSSASSPRFGPIGLGFASRTVDDGAALTAPGGVSAVVTRLPFA
jgi:folate-binding protein YgfZ